MDQDSPRFDQPALEATLSHYLQEVEHMAERILQLEKAIDEAVAHQLPRALKAGEAVQFANHGGCGHLGHSAQRLQRFDHRTDLWTGLRDGGAITKTGNAHLGRMLVEAAWAYRHRPNVTGFLLRRQKSLALSNRRASSSAVIRPAVPLQKTPASLFPEERRR